MNQLELSLWEMVTDCARIIQLAQQTAARASCATPPEQLAAQVQRIEQVRETLSAVAAQLAATGPGCGLPASSLDSVGASQMATLIPAGADCVFIP